MYHKKIISAVNEVKAFTVNRHSLCQNHDTLLFIAMHN